MTMLNSSNANCSNSTLLRLSIPSGRIKEGVIALMREAALEINVLPRNYQPRMNDPAISPTILKSQNLIELLENGECDIGFAGADMVREMGREASITRLMDTDLNPVRVVVAAPPAILENGGLPNARLRIASSFVNLAGEWSGRMGRNDNVMRSYGTTEGLVPTYADCIVDVVDSGATLRANGLEVLEEIMPRSTTRFYASRAAMDDPKKREAIKNFSKRLKQVIAERRGAIVGGKALAARIAKAAQSNDSESRTKKLLDDLKDKVKGKNLLKKKIEEEAEELAIAKTRENAIFEMADVLYFGAVKLYATGVDVAEVWKLRTNADWLNHKIDEVKNAPTDMNWLNNRIRIAGMQLAEVDTKESVTEAMAELLYFGTVRLRRAGTGLKPVWKELAKRAGQPRRPMEAKPSKQQVPSGLGVATEKLFVVPVVALA